MGLTMLDSRTWVELHVGREAGYVRAELHRPMRGPSVGWVDKPQGVESEDAESAVLVVLAGTGYDARAAVDRLGVG